MLDFPRETLEHPWLVLAAVDKQLMTHLDACASKNIATDADVHLSDARCTILWPMLRTALQRCLSTDAWLALWDHIILLWREPHLFGIAAIAVLRCIRDVLLSLPVSSPHRICEVLSQPQVVPIPRLLEEFYLLRRRATELFPKPSKADLEELMPAGKPYPNLPREVNVVLDFLVHDRARARAEIEHARRNLNSAEEKYAAIEALVTDESKARDERALVLNHEE